MQSWSWAPQHCDALREFVGSGLSFSEAATALNRKFGTAYTRSAVIGRAKRMKLVVRARPGAAAKFRMPKPKPAGLQAHGGVGRQVAAGVAAKEAATVTRRAEPVKLR